MFNSQIWSGMLYIHLPFDFSYENNQLFYIMLYHVIIYYDIVHSHHGLAIYILLESDNMNVLTRSGSSIRDIYACKSELI